jgi:hypothetical protein
MLDGDGLLEQRLRRSVTVAHGHVYERTHRPSGRATKEGTVPLSDHEQRLLDQIEQALYAEDPKFASAVRSARARSRTRRSVVLSITGVVVGLGLVLVGLVTSLVVISVIGFVLVVGACGYAAQSLRNRVPAGIDNGPHGSKAARQSGLRTRMEDRLRRRFDDN